MHERVADKGGGIELARRECLDRERILSKRVSF